MEMYLPLVRQTAERLYRKLPNSVDLEDLKSAGVFGLRDAIEGFDLERGVKFETYCTTRIRGAILDELRAVDWVPRLVRTKANKLSKAQQQLETLLGRQPTDGELAEALGMNLGELEAMVREANAVTMVSLSEAWPGSEEDEHALRKVDMLCDRREPEPMARIERKDLLEAATRLLNEKERLIVLLYYFEEMTMREIGLTLGLSESRVCQLHSRIMRRLRKHLGPARLDLLG
ncbi:MAG: FliA/WhiG family RNA polymerase sigma factor [Planctomycetota bacterium]|nr:MAG: FliA/WhiG family RNA polymerase sigma factor [Planctomycetota bacterium]